MSLSREEADLLALLTDDPAFLAIGQTVVVPRPITPDFRLDLDLLDDPAFVFNFRFTRTQILQIIEDLNLPEIMFTQERHKFYTFEAVCIMCRRLAYPARLGDLQQLFGRSRASISMIFNLITSQWVRRFRKILHLDVKRISENLPIFAGAILRRGAPLDKAWGFIDGTVRPCSRPSRHQRVVYNGHKRIHSLKFHTVVTPDGIVAHAYGPVEGCRHDTTLMRESKLLETISATPAFQGYYIYGDPAYPISPWLLSPHKGSNLDAAQEQFNQRMSEVRVAVEWQFHNIVNHWKFLDFKSCLRIFVSPIGNYYLLGVLLTNFLTCLNGRNQISMHFGLQPPSLREYVRNENNE